MQTLVPPITPLAYEPCVIEFLKLFCPLTFQLIKILACITPPLKIIRIRTIFNKPDWIRRIQLMAAYHTRCSLSVTTVNLKPFAHAVTSFKFPIQSASLSH